MSSHGHPSKADLRTLSLFAMASAIAIALGSLGLALYGVPFMSWVRSPIAYGAGLILGVALIAIGRRPGLSVGSIILTVVGLAATMFAPDQSGIHRWLDLGPLHVNAAALLLPIAIVALADGALSGPTVLIAIGTIALLLVAQPDASQATAFALAAALALRVRRDLSQALVLGTTLGLGLMAAIAWLRPDPLQPVPEAEGVFTLLAGLSLPLALTAALALASTSCLPLFRVSKAGGIPSGAPLAAYFTVVATMPLFGHFPVPLIGLGMSFPVGYWVGMAMLCASEPIRNR